MQIDFYDLHIDENGIPSLYKEKSLEYETKQMNTPEKIARFSKDVLQLHKKAEEHIYMLALNTACEVTGVFFLAKGTATAVLTTPKEIFTRAMMAGTSATVLIHNHPSGNTQPSKEDISTTIRTKRAGDIMEIHLIDHIIVTNNDVDPYLSFKESNTIENM